MNGKCLRMPGATDCAQRAALSAARLLRALTSSAFLVLSVWIVSFWALVLRARVYSGQWPRAAGGNPFAGSYQPATVDPAIFGLHYGLACSCMILSIWMVPFAVVSIVLGFRCPILRRSNSFVLAFCLLLMAWVAMFTVDPGGFMTWFFD